MLSLLVQNVRYSVRQLASNPGFSLFAAASLAIGIAASITLFGAAHAFLFAPLRGVGAPDDLVELASATATRSSDSFSAPDFKDCRAPLRHDAVGRFRSGRRHCCSRRSRCWRAICPRGSRRIRRPWSH